MHRLRQIAQSVRGNIFREIYFTKTRKDEEIPNLPDKLFNPKDCHLTYCQKNRSVFVDYYDCF